MSAYCPQNAIIVHDRHIMVFHITILRVATVREKVWKMNFFPGQGKVREFRCDSGKFAKVQKVREKSGNFKIFSKVMVFDNHYENLPMQYKKRYFSAVKLKISLEKV